LDSKIRKNEKKKREKKKKKTDKNHWKLCSCAWHRMRQELSLPTGAQDRMGNEKSTL
jgi:hypothetical protein